MTPAISDLLQKSLKMTPEQLREAESRAKTQTASTDKGEKGPVGRSAEWKRISEIETRPWDYFQRDEFVDAVTDALRTPNGTMRLRPVQAAALIEAQRCKGLVGLMGVGSGKALVSMLLGRVLNAQVTVLLVPPSLLEQTRRVYNQMREHWQVTDSKNFHIVSYSTLSSPKNFDILEKLKPDLIIADEASQLKNKQAAKTKRVFQYLRIFKNTMLCLLSGTLVSRSLKDFQHLMHYVLKDRSPVPAHFPTLNEWCEALDANVKEKDIRKPGAILDFRAAHQTLEQDADVIQTRKFAREALRHRMISTPGVVATAAEELLGVSIIFNKRPLELSDAVREAMEKQRKTWERPDGEAFSDILELAAAERELSCGFWNKWLWPLDKDGAQIIDYEWLEARKNWHKAVRERLRHSSPGMDSPHRLFLACKAGRWSHPAFEPWVKVMERKKPETQAQWVDDRFMIDDAVKWGSELVDGKPAPGIIWFSHVAVGKKIAERGGFPYYGEGAEASARILDETGSRTIVVSMNAHNEGKNLQHAFWRNLFTTPFANGKLGEQVLGRTHRPGQPEDEVICDFYLHTDSFRAAFEKAREDARLSSALLGPQKLDYGTCTFE